MLVFFKLFFIFKNLIIYLFIIIIIITYTIQNS